jgi:hypothetical protein
VKVLDAEKRRVIATQAQVVQQEQFFLAGGTGLGVRLKHRVSRDVDWFTAKAFDAEEIARRLSALPQKPSEVVVRGPHTLRAYYGSLETSFIRYTQVSARPELLDASGLKVPVADLETQALMKAAAVHDRGTRRDFIDIHAICSTSGWSLARFIELATRKLPLQPLQMKLALTYFADADRQEVPIEYRTPWKQVKADLERGVREWERTRSQGR